MCVFIAVGLASVGITWLLCSHIITLPPTSFWAGECYLAHRITLPYMVCPTGIACLGQSPVSVLVCVYTWVPQKLPWYHTSRRVYHLCSALLGLCVQCNVCQVALLDQAEDFVPQKLPSMRKLLDEFHCQVPVQSTAAAKESLDADQFQLLMKQLDYDIKVFENWERKCQHVHVARFHAKKAWKLERQQRATAAASAYMCQNMRHQVWTLKCLHNLRLHAIVIAIVLRLRLLPCDCDCDLVAIASWHTCGCDCELAAIVLRLHCECAAI